MKKTLVLAALGECVHVAGISNFQRLADTVGWHTIFLGPAVPISQVISTAIAENADMVGVSYRLTPETGERLLAEFAEAADELRSNGVRFAFGGTPPLAEKAAKLRFFEKVFIGGELDQEVINYLSGEASSAPQPEEYPGTMLERIHWKSPTPLVRHHFGLPTMDETLKGIEKIASAEVLDVISLGIDQDAQENFYHPDRQDPRQRGAGGVPVRSSEDYAALFAASRRGNYPLMRTYSGTDDFLKLAELYVNTIHIAWCAVPLYWFNQMDGRGPWDLEGSIRQHQEVMRWYGERNIPVELNEPHHWGMRDAPDVVSVVAGYLSAYNARAFGVKDYIAQFMFNSPPGLSDAMDLAKMLAIIELIEPLARPDFKIWRQTRSGLLSFPLDPTEARAHLAAGIYLQMALKPQIVHVVGQTEAHHAATANDVIEACTMARRVIEEALRGAPEMSTDPKVKERTANLVDEAKNKLDQIRNLSKENSRDPFIDPVVLTMAVTSGILDAPQLMGNKFARGLIQTKIVDGACVAFDKSGSIV
jgi:methylmalonyl-CoA mutase cobalamin-binding subunit